MLERLQAKGCAALNIIPDRNWNLRAKDEREQKVQFLDDIVHAANRMQLPINIGTEMNKHGQPFCDDLDGPALKRYRSSFLHGARIMVGHTILARYCDRGYLSEAAAAEFPRLKARNTFFAAVGALQPLTQELANRLVELGSEAAYAEIHDRVSAAD